jgi:amidase
MPSPLPFEDTVGAWVPHGKFSLPPAGVGALNGLTFAVKDVYDVAGYPTGAGNPQWLATHPVPKRHSAVVEQLLAAGASLQGKTLTDELAYSLHGDNMHYGMPLNPSAPERIPGGSSSGSVSAVAARLVDFALATDTGGSTRVPASYCGVWGLRTSHGLLSTQGLVPLQPSFDTVTWLAHSPHTFARVGKLLLPASDFVPSRVLWLSDACAMAEPAFQTALQYVFDVLKDQLGVHAVVDTAAPDTLENWHQTYVTASAFEGWQTHGAWISQNSPVFAPSIAARWQYAAVATQAQASAAQLHRLAIAERLRTLLGDDTVVVLPSAASVAPLRTATGSAIDDVRTRTMRICCIAGLAGLPQVSIPMRSPNGLPVGVSLLGPVGSDHALITLINGINRLVAQ